MGAKRESKDAQTIPATPRSRTSGIPGSQAMVSGLRAAAGSLEGDHEAHGEMLRAVERGVCVIVFETGSEEEGLVNQWSAWLVEGGEVLFQAWSRPKDGRWSRGQSFMASAAAAVSLAELIGAG